MSVVIESLELNFFLFLVLCNKHQYPEKFCINGCSSYYNCGTAATESHPYIVLVHLVQGSLSMQKMERKPKP